jgi:iron complex outermembrane receptor protein
MRSKDLLTAVGVGLLGCGWVLSDVCVAASDAPAESPTAEGGQLEEIVVTAERREENQQRVPVAISVVTGAEALNQGVVGTASLTQAVAGLQFNLQANGATPFIRGVGTVDGATGNESSVATYVDGVYIGSVNGALFELNNIDHIEVLKGPQGTLFGRNATGGVIQIITKDPTSTPSADFRAGYGNYANTQGSFYGTTGLGDTLAVNLAAYGRNQADGFGHDLVTGQSTFTHHDLGGRTKALWTPIDGTRVTLSADYNRTRNEDGIGFHVIPGSVAIDGQTRFNGFYNNNEDPNDYTDVRQVGVSVKVEQDFSVARLVDIASWRNVNGFFLLDQDGTPVPIVRAPIYQHDKTVTEELHLLSKPDAKLPWIGGFYYFNDLSAYDPLGLEGGAAAPLDEIQIWSAQRSKSYAVFGQVTPQIATDTRLTLGARYTKDERTVTGSTLGLIGPATLPLAGATQSTTWNKPTWRVALDHNFTPDVMGYVSYDRGFKSGVYNLLSYADAPVNPEILDAYQIGVKSELADHHVRLNAAAFYYKYKNIQVQEIVSGATISLNAAAAEMKGVDVDFVFAPTRFFTLQGGAEWLHGRYTDFKNAPFNIPNLGPTGQPIGGNTQSAGDATGFDTVRSPEATANLSGDYRVPLSAGSLDFVVSYSYNSGFAWDPDNRVREPAYSLVNASAGWSSPTDRFGLRLWGTNLTDHQYCSYAEATTLLDFCSPNPPRMYGVSVSLHF